jgi:hypothetical protein
MLKYLSHESNISRRQLVLDEVQCSELDLQVLKPNLMEVDQTWNDVASDIPVAKTSDLRSYGEIATSEIDYVGFDCKGTQKGSDRVKVSRDFYVTT